MITYLKNFYCNIVYCIKMLILNILNIKYYYFTPFWDYYSKTLHGFTSLKVMLFDVPYYLAYYSYLLIFKYIILNSLKFFISFLYYAIKVLFYFLYLCCFYIIILYIIKNYFLQLNDLLKYEQTIGTVIDLNSILLLDEKISFLGGFFFDNFLSKFYLNNSYNLELNKIVFLDLVKSKYLFFSLTLQDFFELQFLFTFGWVSDKKIDELFALSNIIYFLFVLKYYIIWLLELFWVFDLIFIQLKYIFWFLINLFILSLFKLTNFYILIKIFNCVNFFFICISDSFLIELGYSLKINIIVLIEWFFSHLLGYIFKTIKFFEIGTINGVMTPHKKLLFLFDDYNRHKSRDFYLQDLITSLDFIDFYTERLLTPGIDFLLLRCDFIIEGSPYMEIPFELNTHASEYDGVTGIDNILEEAKVTSIYFSKLSFLDNYINLNIFNKENILFEDFDINLNNVFNILDNFVKPKKDIGFNGFFGFYGFSTLQLDAYSEPDEDDFFYSDELDYPRNRKRHYFDFGYEENFYVYNLVMFYSYALVIINLLIKFPICFLTILIKIVKNIIVIYIFYYIIYNFYKIDFGNKKKNFFLFFNSVNQLYEPIVNNSFSTLWVFNSKIRYSFFLDFILKNKIQFYKRLICIINEFYFYLKRFLKYLLVLSYSKILNLTIKISLFIVKHLNLKRKLFKLVWSLKLKVFLLKKFILFLFSIFNFENLFFFIIFRFLKIIEYIIMFLIILFIWNLLYLFIFILDILYDISIFDFYPTYVILFLLIITMFSLSGINNFNKHLLGNLGNYINNNRLFISLDGADEFDELDENAVNDEIEDEYLDDILDIDPTFPMSDDSIIGDIGAVRVDIGKSKYHSLLLQRFDLFMIEDDGSFFTFFGFMSLKITYDNLLDLMLLLPQPYFSKKLSYYKLMYNTVVKTLLLEQFIEHFPDTFNDLDLFYRNDDDFLFGLKINPLKMRRYLCAIDSLEPEVETFSDYSWYDSFFIDNLYPLSMYDENFTFLNYKSNLNKLLLLPIDNSNYLINNFNNLSFYNRFGDFNPFNFDYDNENIILMEDSLDDDFDVLLDLEFPMFFQEYYVGFQANHSLLNLKKINKMPIILYNLYECYDNKYKRKFYKNLAYYKKILNLNFFPYVTAYEHQKILFYLHCNEKTWNNIDKKPKNFIIEYQFYDFPIFIILSFQFFLMLNNTEPFGTLFQDLNFLEEMEIDILHAYIFNEPIISTSAFIDNFTNNINNLLFEKIILILSSPGYLHENCWRFSKFLYLILYGFVFILPDNIIGQFIYINTINYIVFIDFILDFWEFNYRFFLGYGLYDLLFIIF